MVDEKTIMVTLKAAIDQFTKPMQEAQKELKKTAEAADGASKGIGISAQTMAKLGVAAGAAMTGLAGGAEMLIDKYHSLSSVTEQVSIMTGESSDALQDMALSMTDADRSAGETAKTFYELAQSGIETTGEMEKVGAVLFDLEEAFDVNATTIVETLDPALKAFGEDMMWVADNADELSYVLTETQLSISEIGSYAARVGPDLKELGLTFEDYLAILSAFADKGLTGRKAISEMNQAIKNANESGADAAKNYDKASEAVGKYEVTVMRLEEKQRKLNEKLADGKIDQQEYNAEMAILSKELEQAQKKLQDNQQTMDANNKIMQEGVDKQALFYQSLGMTREEIEKQKGAMQGAAGLTEKMAEAADKGDSAFANLARSIDNMMIRAGKMLEPYQGLFDILLGLGPVLTLVNGLIAMQNSLKSWNITVTALETAATGAFTAATTAAAGAVGALDAAIAANPIGALLIAIVAVTAALVLLYQNCEEFRNIVDGIIGILKWELAAALDWIQTYIRAFIKFLRGDFEGAFNDLRETWRKVCQSMPEPMKDACNAIVSYANIIIDIANKLIDTLRGLPIIGKAFEGLEPLNHITVDVFNHEDKATEAAKKEAEAAKGSTGALIKPPTDMWHYPKSALGLLGDEGLTAVYHSDGTITYEPISKYKKPITSTPTPTMSEQEKIWKAIEMSWGDFAHIAASTTGLAGPYRMWTGNVPGDWINKQQPPSWLTPVGPEALKQTKIGELTASEAALYKSVLMGGSATGAGATGLEALSKQNLNLISDGALLKIYQNPASEPALNVLNRSRLGEQLSIYGSIIGSVLAPIGNAINKIPELLTEKPTGVPKPINWTEVFGKVFPVTKAEAHAAPGMPGHLPTEDQLGVPDLSEWVKSIPGSIGSIASSIGKALYGKETWQEAANDIGDSVGDDLTNLGRLDAKNASSIMSSNKDALIKNSSILSSTQLSATGAMIRAAQENTAYGASINQTGFSAIYSKVSEAYGEIVNPIVAAIQTADADICYWLQNGAGAKAPEQLAREQATYNNPPPYSGPIWPTNSIAYQSGGLFGGLTPTKNGWGIPIFASGGIVNKATLGLIGESGPEAVVPLDRIGGGKNINIIIEMDSKVIAKATAPATASLIRLRQGIRG